MVGVSCLEIYFRVYLGLFQYQGYKTSCFKFNQDAWQTPARSEDSDESNIEDASAVHAEKPVVQQSHVKESRDATDKKKKKKKKAQANAFTAFDSNINTNDEDLHALFVNNDFDMRQAESHIVFLDYTTNYGLFGTLSFSSGLWISIKLSL